MQRIALALSLTFSLALSTSAAEPFTFKKTKLDEKFRGEGVAVGDFNHDGNLDLATGEGYYAAPDWKFQPIREQAREFDPLKYSECFQAWARDFNNDGWDDLLVVEFPGRPTVWLENPKGVERPWTRRVAVEVTNNESPEFTDVDGDGFSDLLLGTSADPKNSDGPEKYMAIARPDPDPKKPWKLQTVSEKNVDMARKFYHGIGAGDLNGDGLLDIVTPNGWWQQPRLGDRRPTWAFTPAKLGEPCAQMHVFDFDGDGDADVLSSAAHKLGMWWHEQTKEGWQTHEISQDFSQTHALVHVDLNGDNLPDFVTGKRYWAHGPNGDVNPGDPAVLYWFELSRKEGKPVWTPHKIDDDSGVGTQFQVTDVTGDGKLDIAIANKKGVFLFEQVRE